MHTWTVTTTTAGTFTIRASTYHAAMRIIIDHLESWGHEDARVLSVVCAA